MLSISPINILANFESKEKHLNREEDIIGFCSDSGDSITGSSDIKSMSSSGSTGSIADSKRSSKDDLIFLRSFPIICPIKRLKKDKYFTLFILIIHMD